MRNDNTGDTAGPKVNASTQLSFPSFNGVNLRSDAAALLDTFED
jgi:hypothetical protein